MPEDTPAAQATGSKPIVENEAPRLGAGNVPLTHEHIAHALHQLKLRFDAHVNSQNDAGVRQARRLAEVSENLRRQFDLRIDLLTKRVAALEARLSPEEQKP